MTDDFEAAELKIWLLGGFKVQVKTALIDDAAWRLRRARHLVSLLALTPGHRLHREQIMDLFWPDLTPKAASNNLRGVLHFARRLLADTGHQVANSLQRHDEVIALSTTAPIWIDSVAFESAILQAHQSREPEAYQAALHLYQGVSATR